MRRMAVQWVMPAGPDVHQPGSHTVHRAHLVDLDECEVGAAVLGARGRLPRQVRGDLDEQRPDRGAVDGRDRVERRQPGRLVRATATIVRSRRRTGSHRSPSVLWCTAHSAGRRTRAKEGVATSVAAVDVRHARPQACFVEPQPRRMRPNIIATLVDAADRSGWRPAQGDGGRVTVRVVHENRDLHPVRDGELGEQTRDVRLDRGLAHEQRCGNLGVGRRRTPPRSRPPAPGR